MLEKLKGVIMNWQNIYSKVSEMTIMYIPKLALGVFTLIIGLWLAGILTKLIIAGSKKSKVDETLVGFIDSFIGAVLKVLVIISVASMVGIKMTSFIAILSAMAFAIGLAFQGSLSNFAGGVLIILLKPFKVGDYIEAQGHSGSVDAIQIFHTILKTVDNKTIIIPNGPLSNGNVINYTSESSRRVDFSFGIGYQDDFTKAKKIILDIVSKDRRILQDPAPFARVGELGDSSVNITVRIWCKTADYWDVHFDMIEQVKTAFDANNIEIPYPQTDVHIHNS